LSSGVLTKASITQVVRLSGNLSKVILAFPFLSVVKSLTNIAVSLKFPLAFFESHHFTPFSQLHHFSQELVSLTSSFSTKYFKEEKLITHKYLFIS
jgi:hypothetical protein